LIVKSALFVLEQGAMVASSKRDK